MVTVSVVLYPWMVVVVCVYVMPFVFQDQSRQLANQGELAGVYVRLF
jgi:hypothetical protein